MAELPSDSATALPCVERDPEACHRSLVAARTRAAHDRLFHHKKTDATSQCLCGKSYEKCDMAQIADRWDGVEWWEQSQSGQAYRGQRHYLRRDHPALQDRNYFRDVYGA